MITHVVLFKFDEAADAAECVDRLRAMAGGVPGLRSLEAGVNVVPAARAYDVALVATFDSLDDLTAYGDHPAHQPVIDLVRERSSSVVAVDFEG